MVRDDEIGRHFVNGMCGLLVNLCGSCCREIDGWGEVILIHEELCYPSLPCPCHSRALPDKRYVRASSFRDSGEANVSEEVFGKIGFIGFCGGGKTQSFSPCPSLEVSSDWRPVRIFLIRCRLLSERQAAISTSFLAHPSTSLPRTSAQVPAAPLSPHVYVPELLELL
jgi:hypothetical protein